MPSEDNKPVEKPEKPVEKPAEQDLLENVIPLDDFSSKAGDSLDQDSDSLAATIFKINLDYRVMEVNLGNQMLLSFEKFLNDLFDSQKEDNSIKSQLQEIEKSSSLPADQLKDSKRKLKSVTDGKEHIRGFYINPEGKITVTVSTEFKKFYDKANDEQKAKLNEYLQDVGEKEAIQSSLTRGSFIAGLFPPSNPFEKSAKVENQLSKLKTQRNKVMKKVVDYIKDDIRKDDDKNKSSKLAHIPNDIKKIIEEKSTIIQDIDKSIKNIEVNC